jgi:GTPase
VRDVAHEDSEAQAQDVTGILKDLGIDPANGQRIIEVWNKLDLLADEDRQKQMALAALRPVGQRPVPLSALTGEGNAALLDGIEARIAVSRPVYRLDLPPGDGKSLAWLHAEAEILARSDGEDGTLSLIVRLPPERAGAFLSRFPEAQTSDAPSP